MYAIYGNMDPINIPQMLAYIPYMDPMGYSILTVLCQILEKWEAKPAAGAGSAGGFGATRRGPWSDPDLLLGSAQNLGRWKRWKKVIQLHF